jgi:hypothetical protein
MSSGPIAPVETDTNDAAIGGLVFGLATALGVAYLAFVLAAGGSFDGAQVGSLLDRMGTAGGLMIIFGLLIVLPAIPFVAIAGVITSAVGIRRAETHGRLGEAALGLALCVLGGLAFLAVLAS